VAFAYYSRLTPAQQRVYRQSDGVTSLQLPRPAELWPVVARLGEALALEDRGRVELVSGELLSGLTAAFGVRACRLMVRSARPHGRWGELQGLYTTGTRLRPPTVELWMRTARQRRVVAFRTYVRTLLHELCHHLDYAHLRLRDSFHTQGFYSRESSLVHQLLPAPETRGVQPGGAGA
jgi:hypothetical protein